MWIVKKLKDFYNITTWNVKKLAGNENELIGELWREYLDMLEVSETNRKIRGNGNRRRLFFDL